MKVAQISDLHLTKNGQIIWDTDTLSHFKSAYRILASIKDLDAIVISGDLSNDGSEWTYRYIDDLLSSLDVPVYCCLGNHDSKAPLQMTFKCMRFEQMAMIGEWKFIFVSSVIENPEEVGRFKSRGWISTDDLKYLQSEIHTGHKTAVVLHHPPLEPGGWLNRKPLENRDAFNDIIQGSDVRLVLFGHIHYALQQTFNGILYSSAPSVGFAYDKELPKYQIAEGNEGISIITLCGDISIETKILNNSRIKFCNRAEND